MRRPQDRAVPVAHEQVLRVLEAVAARLRAEALFALFELLEQAEVARDLGAHGCGCWFDGWSFLPLTAMSAASMGSVVRGRREIVDDGTTRGGYRAGWGPCKQAERACGGGMAAPGAGHFHCQMSIGAVKLLAPPRGWAQSPHSSALYNYCTRRTAATAKYRPLAPSCGSSKLPSPAHPLRRALSNLNHHATQQDTVRHDHHRPPHPPSLWPMRGVTRTLRL